MKTNKLITALCLLALPLLAADAQTTPNNGGRKVEKPPNFIPAKADPLMGDWQGEGGLVAQVFPTTGGNYQANLLSAFDTESNLVAVLQGTIVDGVIIFNGEGWMGEIKDSHFTGGKDGKKFDLQHIVRVSPTEGAKPPAGAVILFDGKNLDAWAKKSGKDWLTEDGPAKWKLVDGGAMEVVPDTDCLITHKKFRDCHLHVGLSHARIAEQQRRISAGPLRGEHQWKRPTAAWIGTSNGGFDNCTDKVEPRIRPCFPPLAWQTFDIDFTAPKFDAAGKKAADARATVLFNGVKIYDHQKLDLPHGAAARLGEAATGPLMLQEHGMPVQFRNIWLVEKAD